MQEAEKFNIILSKVFTVQQYGTVKIYIQENVSNFYQSDIEVFHNVAQVAAMDDQRIQLGFDISDMFTSTRAVTSTSF